MYILCLTLAMLNRVSTHEKKIEFTSSIARNENGRWNINFSPQEETSNSKWKINTKRSITEYASQSKGLLRLSIVSSLQPTDYELLPGIGYYKFHKEGAFGFHAAASACSQEGGHLAIINSDEESRAIKNFYARSHISQDWVYAGLEKFTKGNEWQTVFGEPMTLTGFTKWAENQPDNYGDDEFCISIDRDGFYNDIDCYGNQPFLCEYNLSWHTD